MYTRDAEQPWGWHERKQAEWPKQEGGKGRIDEKPQPHIDPVEVMTTSKNSTVAPEDGELAPSRLPDPLLDRDGEGNHQHQPEEYPRPLGIRCPLGNRVDSQAHGEKLPFLAQGKALLSSQDGIREIAAGPPQVDRLVPPRSWWGSVCHKVVPLLPLDQG